MRNLCGLGLCLLLVLAVGCGPAATSAPKPGGAGDAIKKSAEEAAKKAAEAGKKVGEEAGKVADEGKKAAEDAAKKVGEFTEDAKKKLAGEMTEKLGIFDKQIGELKDKAGKATGDLKKTLEAKLPGIEDLRKQLGGVFDKLKTATADNWTTITKDFSGLLEKITTAIKEAMDAK